jgi:hypothetical protein
MSDTLVDVMKYLKDGGKPANKSKWYSFDLTII